MVYVETSLDEAFAKPFAAPVLDLSSYLNESYDFSIMVSLNEAEETDENGEKKGFAKVAWAKIVELAKKFGEFCLNVMKKVRDFFTKVLSKVQKTMVENSAENLAKIVEKNKDKEIAEGFELEIVDTSKAMKLVDALNGVINAVSDAVGDVHAKYIDAFGDNSIDSFFDECRSKVDASIKECESSVEGFKFVSTYRLDEVAVTKMAVKGGETVGFAYESSVKPIADGLKSKLGSVIESEKKFNKICKDGNEVAKSIISNQKKDHPDFAKACRNVIAFSKELTNQATTATTIQINAIVSVYKAANKATGHILKSAKDVQRGKNNVKNDASKQSSSNNEDKKLNAAKAMHTTFGKGKVPEKKY